MNWIKDREGSEAVKPNEKSARACTMLFCLISFAYTTVVTVVCTATIQHPPRIFVHCVAVFCGAAGLPFHANPDAGNRHLRRLKQQPIRVRELFHSSKRLFFESRDSHELHHFLFLPGYFLLLNCIQVSSSSPRNAVVAFTLNFLHLSPLFAFLFTLRHRSPDFLSRRQISPKVSSTFYPQNLDRSAL